MAGDVILLYIHVYHKRRSYDIWFLKYKVQQKFSTFQVIYCPFSPLTIWKIKFLTLKKTPGGIIILHIFTINDNHMIYGSWDMECDKQFFFILDRFLSFYPLWTQKIKIFKKNGKNNWRYYHFTCINDSYMMYGSSDMECNRQNFLSFWSIFWPFIPLQPEKSKFWKTEKWTWRYHHFTQLYQKSWSYPYCSWDMACDRCNCCFSFCTIFCPFTPF